MTTVVTQKPIAIQAAEDGIGLSITVSSDQDQHDCNKKDNENENENENDNDNDNDNITATKAAAVTTTTPNMILPTFIPPSVDPSPIPFEDGDHEGNFDNNHMHDRYHNHNHNHNPVISSIMREPSIQQPQSPILPVVDNNQSTNLVVTTLEERVRDLEEKLSTLSMLLLQQNQRLSPRTHNNNNNNNSPHRKSYSPSSPDESGIGCSDSASSMSPPTTPFRSLASFSTIRTSNIPVLESPTPVIRRYRNNGIDSNDNINNNSNSNNNISTHQDHSFGDFSRPYEHRSPQHQHPNGRALTKSSRGHRNNLSYQILHAPDNNDSFENACRVPSLDSLPGSSRTSPIESNYRIVNEVLSQQLQHQQEQQQHQPQDQQQQQQQQQQQHQMLNERTRSSSSADNSAASTPQSISTATTTLSPHATSSISTQHKREASQKPSESKEASSIFNSHSHDGTATNESKTDNSEAAASKHKKKKSNIKSKWLDYLNSVQESNYDTDKQMEEFVKVPSKVEALLSFGFWISVDSFLYTLTMLPLRFVYSLLLLTVWFYTKIVGRTASNNFQFHRHNSYHMIQVSIIYIIYQYVLKPIDISIMYHMIRNQSMVKLYLLVAMVEVFDRLMCSLGQDCLDSLYWNTTRRPRSSRLIVSALVVLVYTALHSFLLFVHVATLNVAMNSDDQALLSLLIGGNFAEIKGTVFKKYNKATLFKITASDICERFKLALFLFLVLMLNASQGMDKKMYYNYLSMCGIVVGGEWLSDWLKHSFITKFNYIASSVYSEYSLLLAGDVSGFGHEGTGENLDKSHAVVKRLGLAQIPLVCVMVKYLKEAYKYQMYGIHQPPRWMLVVGTLSVWLLLLVTKLSLASVLQTMSKNKLEAAPEFSKNNATVAKKKNQ